MEVRANAKLNLTLEVLGRRPDGYHEVTTVLQAIDLADRLHFTPAPKLDVECSLPELTGEDNLVWQAADALKRATRYDQGAKIRLEKRIPVGMGLGGGSSDAAATLIALACLWGLGREEAELRSIAASLGSDVPFFLSGGTALGEGRGDRIADLPPIPERWIVLLCPSDPVAREDASRSSKMAKTVRLYSLLGQEHYTDGSRTLTLANDLKEGRFSPENLFNVFERVAPGGFPGFERAQQDFLEAGAGLVHLTGTGPGFYTFVSEKEDGDRILKSLKRMGREAYCVSTVQPAVSLLRPGTEFGDSRRGIPV